MTLQLLASSHSPGGGGGGGRNAKLSKSAVYMYISDHPVNNTYVQWNPSNADTDGTKEKCPEYRGVPISGVS